MVVEVHFEPNYRAVVAHATISLKNVQMINVYLKSGGEPHELCVTLEWTVPFLLKTEFFTIYGGDFQGNPGRDTSRPLASIAISTATFTDTSLRGVPKEQDMPIWVAPQGFYGALEDFFIPEPPKYHATVRVQATSSFPSDHIPILLYIQNFTHINPPSALQHTGRIISPKVLSRAMKNQCHTAFDEILLNTAGAPKDECQHFSTAVLQAGKKKFGPRANLTTVPRVVPRVVPNRYATICNTVSIPVERHHTYTHISKEESTNQRSMGFGTVGAQTTDINH